MATLQYPTKHQDSTLLQLQRKRHIGNDIVCVVFLEADRTNFSPACIKSHFLHTFIVVRCGARSSSSSAAGGRTRSPTRYEVSVVTRDEVGAYKPYLWEQSVFTKGPMFREWILTKVGSTVKSPFFSRSSILLSPFFNLVCTSNIFAS